MKIKTKILKIWRKIMAYINGKEILFSSCIGEGGTQQPQLFAPTISLSGDTLTITNDNSNGAFVSHFEVLANGEVKKSINVGEACDLSTLGLLAGSYTITARARGNYFKASADSNSVSYSVSGGSSVVNDISVTYNLTGVTTDGVDTIPKELLNTKVLVKVTADDGYELPKSVSVSGCSYNWHRSLGYLYLQDFTDDVVITITAEKFVAQTFNIITNLTNVTADQSNVTTVRNDYGATLKFTANDGYTLPAEITATNCEYMWWNNTGELIIAQGTTGDIVVTIVGVKTDSGGDGEDTTTYVIEAGTWIADNCDQYYDDPYATGNDGVEANTWKRMLTDSDVTLPCRIDFENGGIETAEIYYNDCDGYVCYGVTFQTDGRMTFNLEDATDVDAICDGDDADDVYLHIDAETYPDGITLNENQYKAWMAVFFKYVPEEN